MLKRNPPRHRALVALTVIAGLGFPLAMTGVAGAIFPYQAQGASLKRMARSSARL